MSSMNVHVSVERSGRKNQGRDFQVLKGNKRINKVPKFMLIHEKDEHDFLVILGDLGLGRVDIEIDKKKIANF